jgi:histidyl-tRNA synthetase
MGKLVEAAPMLIDQLDAESLEHFELLKQILSSSGIGFTVKPRLVRGLDYYTRTVFEWVTTELGAQGAVCGGGRYDGLVEEIGGRATPATGFALGIERLVELLKLHEIQPAAARSHAYLAALGDAARIEAHPLAEQLRDSVPGLRLIVDASADSVKKKMRSADRSEASLALLVGDDELASETVSVKYLRETTEQQSLSRRELTELLKRRLDGRS